MSNVDIARRSYEAFERKDLAGVVAEMSEEIRWEQAQGLPHGGLYEGLPAVVEHIFGPLDAEWWAEFHAVPAEFLDAGEHVVVLGRYTGRAKVTGKPLDVPYVHVWTVEAGKVVRFRQFLDTAGWVEALAR